MKLSITVTGLAEVKNEMLKLDRRLKVSRLPVMQKIADRLADRIRRNLSQGGFAAISPVTERFRATRRNKSRTGGNTPLSDTGALAASVKSQATDFVAEAAATKFYAGFVQLGITTSEKSAVPGKVVPGRPFMTLEPQDVDWAMERLADFVFGEGDRAAA